MTLNCKTRYGGQQNTNEKKRTRSWEAKRNFFFLNEKEKSWKSVHGIFGISGSLMQYFKIFKNIQSTKTITVLRILVDSSWWRVPHAHLENWSFKNTNLLKISTGPFSDQAALHTWGTIIHVERKNTTPARLPFEGKFMFSRPQAAKSTALVFVSVLWKHSRKVFSWAVV